jgi:hypothetical protein
LRGDFSVAIRPKTQSMGAMVQLPENCTPLSMNTSGACSVPETRAGT